MKIRKHSDRGTFKIDWLDAKYTFSFANYYDPSHMGFQTLRVINNDIIAPGGGFAPHSHKDMEIVTFIIKGELSHKDSLGNVETIRPGMIQIMSAGSGITHSEFNPSPKNEVELFQIWISPKERNLKPDYSEFLFENLVEKNRLNLITSGSKEDEVGFINQDLKIFYFDSENHEIELSSNNSYWLQLIDGEIEIEEKKLSYRDAISFTREDIKVKLGKARGLLFQF